MSIGQNRKLILVADDADEDFFLLQRAFSNAGLNHVLFHVRSGSDAIKYLDGSPPYEDRTAHPLPNLVIIDAKMPSGSGLDVLQASRNGRFKIPFVMLSGSGAPGDTELILKSGAAEYLHKPAEPSELVLLAQTIHHRWLTGTSPKGQHT